MKPQQRPPIQPRTYIGIWAVLVLLLLLNWGLAQFNLGRFNLVATLAIAFVQMLLMLLFLMHLLYQAPLIRVFAAAGFIWLIINLDLTLSDYFSRGSVPGTLRQSWQHGAWPTREGPAAPGASGSN